MKKSFALLALCALALAACAKDASQNQYMESEVGSAKTVQYGTVVSSRTVGITGKSSGVGTLVGGGIGGGAASYAGSGSGRTWATAGGAIAGAIAGSMLEQNMQDEDGVEYTVRIDGSETITIVQRFEDGDMMYSKGDRVMVQSGRGYERVLPAVNDPRAKKTY